MTRTTSFAHDALLYSGLEEFVAGACAFVDEGCLAGEPVMVSIPRAKHDALRAGLRGHADRVDFVDMDELGRNPGRIIPEMHAWIQQHGEQRWRFVGEPIWAGRGRDETTEAIRHEALLNVAFADCNAHILCPYDKAALAPEVLCDVERTHPSVICDHERHGSSRYTDPIRIWESADSSLPPAPQDAAVMPITADLAEVRQVASGWARDGGLASARVGDVVLSIDEAATNALQHGQSPASVRFWQDERTLVFEVTDAGQFDEPLAGRRRPEPHWLDGRGLWLINQLCDLVEVRPGTFGTTVRMHVDV